MSKSKRTKILVDPKVQWAIGRRVMYHWFMFGICFISLNIFIRTLLSIANQSIMDSLLISVRSQIPVLFIFSVMLPMFLLDTMKLTNRFAGPMFRLRNAMRALPSDAQGAMLKFRSGDFWPEAADEFNRVAKEVDSLRRRNVELEGELHELRKERDLQTV
jgi:hypothetical protein